MVLQILREEDPSHPAMPNFTIDGVAIREDRGAENLERIVHRWRAPV
ncbi:MAG: hypothetical protein H0W30_04425 [Gemmatimonadaceae bacterium]|nr:hypothetical protein [Gemmatimonadaceae bacterium]